MKIVGKLPPAKGWVVHYNTLTGRVYGGYEAPIGYKEKDIDFVVKSAKEYLKNNNYIPEKDIPPRPDFVHKGTVSEEAYIKYEKERKEYLDTINGNRQYDEAEEKQYWSFYNFMPVFRSKMLFTGYGRGRSSVTMNFKSENGSQLAFGPSGIDAFIENVANGNILIKDGMFDITFKMVKQGANVYMQPVYNDDTVEWIEE